MATENAEYEMAEHIARAYMHLKEAKAWNIDIVNDGALNDATHALHRLWEAASEENRRLVDLLAICDMEDLSRQPPRRPAAALTTQHLDLLGRCAAFVLAGEWPWEPEKMGEREALDEALDLVAALEGVKRRAVGARR